MMRAAIFVGGQGRRMGVADKALLCIDGMPMLERQLDVLRAHFTDIALCTSRPEEFASFSLPCLEDEAVGAGPLAALVSALSWAAPADVFVVAGDMPYLDSRVIKLFARVASENPEASVIACQAGGLVQPLHAIYRSRDLDEWRGSLASGRRSLRALLAASGAKVTWVDEEELREVDPNLDFLTNINHPEQLR